MSEFNTSLLREKFVLNDPLGSLSDKPPVIVLSNRIVVSLTNDLYKENETFVVRTQNMHSCVRLAGAIAKEFFDRGAITPRIEPFRWENLWRDVIKGYEREWNPDIWGCIYHNGQLLFEEGEHHQFLDIIEKCDAKNKGEYDSSITFAEEAFKQAGKDMKIEHDANIALIIRIGKEEAKCGVILRGADKTNTFNYTITPKKEELKIPTLLSVSAAFLEGIQLAFTVGLINKKRSNNLIEKYSDEDRKGDKSTQRLMNLNTAISRFEQKYTVSYRPERPNFAEMTDEAEVFAMKILAPQIREKIESGELSPPPEEDWVI